MSTEIFYGEKVRLCIADLDKDMELIVKWDQDSEYQRFLSGGVANRYHLKQMKEFFENELEEMHSFFIHTLADDQCIGMVDLSGFDWVVGNACIGIGIGERDFWGKGYGTDAMRVIVRYGFEALNLRRLTLTVFDFNQRAQASYKKAGFVEEGRLPGVLLKANQRYDLIFMRLMRSDWEAAQNG